MLFARSTVLDLGALEEGAVPLTVKDVVQLRPYGCLIVSVRPG
ncbi:hypothetical protein [Nonomuraea dietziae]